MDRCARTSGDFWRVRAFLLACVVLNCLGASAATGLSGPSAAAAGAQSGAAVARQPGTVKAISGNSITLAADSGAEFAIVVQEGAKVVRVAPGRKDLKDAKAILLSDIQPGDRILVRGTAGALANSIAASSVIVMAQSDIAAKQARDREEWQKHGIGGLVTAVDSAGGAISVTTAAIADKKNVTVHVTPETTLRRYAPDSVKFDDAKLAAIAEVKPGDQLRARGSRSEDGGEIKADEIVSGTFRNIAGTVISGDAASGLLTLQDLATKKPVTLKVTAESQLRKLPAPIAQRIAARLKGGSADTTGADSSAAANGSSTAPNNDAPRGRPTGAGPGSGAGPGAGPGAGGGMGRAGGAADFQQIISRMPAATLGDLQKGDAVILVATEGTATSPSTVITLLGGVEAILQASPNGTASTILSPWSLSSSPEGGATP
jgi:co-chaperonin GroES (HSP10)